jgi:hypothetical protein
VASIPEKERIETATLAPKTQLHPDMPTAFASNAGEGLKVIMLGAVVSRGVAYLWIKLRLQ